MHRFSRLMHRVRSNKTHHTRKRVTAMTTTTYHREIVYDRETRDYAMYLDGELVGFDRTYSQAEVTLDQLVFELMTGQYYREQPDALPAQLPSVVDKLVADVNWNSHADPPAPEPNPLGDEEGDSTPPDRPRARWHRDSRFDQNERAAWRSAGGLLRWVADGRDPNV